MGVASKGSSRADESLALGTYGNIWEQRRTCVSRGVLSSRGMLERDKRQRGSERARASNPNEWLPNSGNCCISRVSTAQLLVATCRFANFSTLWAPLQFAAENCGVILLVSSRRPAAFLHSLWCSFYVLLLRLDEFFRTHLVFFSTIRVVDGKRQAVEFKLLFAVVWAVKAPLLG